MVKKILSVTLLMIALTSVPTAANAAKMIELIDVEQQVQVVLVDNMLHVSGANGQIMHIYNVAGVRIMSVKVDGMEKRFDLNLSKGCYIVKVGKTARKISIK